MKNAFIHETGIPGVKLHLSVFKNFNALQAEFIVINAIYEFSATVNVTLQIETKFQLLEHTARVRGDI